MQRFISGSSVSLLLLYFPFWKRLLLINCETKSNSLSLSLSLCVWFDIKKDLKDFMRKAGRVTFADILKDREGEG